MNTRLDMEKIATALGAERRGAIEVSGGYFGAQQLAGEIAGRVQTPRRGGRPTDPRLTLRRLVGLSPETLNRLEQIAEHIRRDRRISVDPMQVAAVLLEKATDQVNLEEDPLHRRDT